MESARLIIRLLRNYWIYAIKWDLLLWTKVSICGRSKKQNTITISTGMHGIRKTWKIRFCGTEIIRAFLSGVSAMRFRSNGKRMAVHFELPGNFEVSSDHWIRLGRLRPHSMTRNGRRMAFYSLALWIWWVTITIKMLFPHSPMFSRVRSLSERKRFLHWKPGEVMICLLTAFGAGPPVMMSTLPEEILT